MVQINVFTWWIDFGYKVKLPLAQAVDRAAGITEAHPYSVVALLEACYEMRRPMFESIDSMLSTVVSGFR